MMILNWKKTSSWFIQKYPSIVGLTSRVNVKRQFASHDFYLFQALRLAPSTRRTTTTGEIVNIMSVDAQKIHDFCCWMHESWAGFVTLVFSVTLLYFVIGPVAFASLLVLLILLPLNSLLMGKYYTKLQVRFIIYIWFIIILCLFLHAVSQ